MQNFTFIFTDTLTGLSSTVTAATAKIAYDSFKRDLKVLINSQLNGKDKKIDIFRAPKYHDKGRYKVETLGFFGGVDFFDLDYTVVNLSDGYAKNDYADVDGIADDAGEASMARGGSSSPLHDAIARIEARAGKKWNGKVYGKGNSESIYINNVKYMVSSLIAA